MLKDFPNGALVTAGSQAPDPGEVSAEQFARLVAAWEDDAIITEGVRAVGVDALLERVFEEMTARIRPDALPAAATEVQWIIDEPGGRHAWVLTLRDGAASASPGRTDDARTTFEMDVATFARLITGQANPIRLVVSRKLKVGGDLLFARKVPTFFDMPGPD